MPRAKVYLRPDVARVMPSETVIGFLNQVRKLVANHLQLPTGTVEAFSVVVQHATNTPPISVDVMFTVRPETEHALGEVDKIAKELADDLYESPWIPDLVDKVAVWVLPQHKAKYATSGKRKG